MVPEAIIALSPADAHLARTVLDRMEEGEPYAAACKAMAVSPSWLMKRIALFPALTARFQAVRAAAAEMHFAKTVALGDEVLSVEASQVPAYKVAIETNKWAAEKLNPTAYGPKSESVVVHKTAPAELSTREKLERFRAHAKGLAQEDTPPATETAIDLDPGQVFDSSAPTSDTPDLSIEEMLE